MGKYLLRLSLAFLILTGGAFGVAFFPAAFEYGITQPVAITPYLNGTFPDATPSQGTGGWKIVNAYPNLTFVDPIQMVEYPGTNKILVAGKKGSLWIFDNDPTVTTKQVFLNIEPVVRTGGDTGLMNALFHPDFATNPNKRFIYVFYRYTLNQGRQEAYIRLSRFTIPQGSLIADRNSELVLINQYDRHDWHNGGGMFFHPDDGFLYLTIGDEGGANDQFNSSQQITKNLLGGLLRIDVDKRGGNISHPIRKQPQNPATPPAGWPNSYTQEYYIPNDNPWLDPVNNSIQEEFYAIGLRSPHRLSYDPETGDMWYGDVGQGRREEVGIIAKADNMQWPFKEGEINGPKAQPANLIGTSRDPVYAYPRNIGTCVIGGIVYRGDKYPSLKGKYIFGDHTVRNVWALDYNKISGSKTIQTLVNVPAEGIGGKAGISHFSVNSQGDIFVLKLFGTNRDGGKIYRIEPNGFTAEPPALLSQTGAFKNLNTLTPEDGIIPYTVNAKLWSDGAIKKRWIAIPNDGTHNTAAEKISFNERSEWAFPEGTVIIKHFELPIDKRNPSLTKKLETRFIILKKGGGVYGVTYKWNAAGTDATLLTSGDLANYDVIQEDGSSRTQSWEFPSREQCLTCHNNNAGDVLGIKTHQLNGELSYPLSGKTANQLASWGHIGLFDNNFDENKINTYPKSVDINDESASLELRVRSYIDANCSFCHRPNGVNANFDTRFNTSLAGTNLINGELQGSYGVPGAAVIKPRDVAKSIFHTRDNSVGEDRMPPIAKNLVDEDYIQVLTDWINSMDPNPDFTPKDEDMIAWWKLDEDVQDYIDDADGAFVGGAGLINDAERGPVALFDQNGKMAQIAHKPQLEVGAGDDEFTVSFWMKLRATNNNLWRSIMHKGANDQQRTWAIWLRPQDNRVHYRISTTSNTNEGGDGNLNLPLNEWAHLSYVKQGKELKLYINGQLDNRVSLVGTPLANTGTLYLGGNPWSQDDVNHCLDDVRLYGRSLAAVEVQSLYNKTNGGIPSAVISVNPETGRAPLDVTFNAAGSFIPSGRVATYSWDFGDNTSGNGINATHRYATPGQYTAKLTIEDEKGNIAVQTKDIFVVDPNACIADGELSYEVWNNISGTIIANLTSNANFPDNPTSSTTITALFEGQLNAADNYGSRIAGTLCAPESGEYTFYIAADDNAELWLSTDENPANAERIAHVPGWSESRQYTKFPEQTSAKISLLQGQKYHIYALHKEGGGGDNLSVGWTKPSGADERPIPASYFSLPNYNPNRPPTAAFSASPESGYAPLVVDFNASASSDPDDDQLTYNWDFDDGTTGTGETIQHTFTNSGTYKVSLTVNDGRGGVNSVDKFITANAKETQSITFNQIADKFTTANPFQIVATASSGLPVSLEIVSGPATINGSIISLNGQTGEVVVKASQPGNQAYEAALPVNRSFQVKKQDQTITFAALSNKYTNDLPFTVSATASSGLPVNFIIVSGPATINGNTITLDGTAGTVKVRARQAGNADFNTASNITRSFNVLSATEPCDNPVNLALNKPTKLSTVYDGLNGSYAVDGQTGGDRNNNGDLMAHSDYELSPWMEIDLEQVSDVREIKLYNRTDCCQDRLAITYFFVSDIPFSGNTIAELQAQSGVSTYILNEIAGSPSTMNIGRTARYIRIQIPTEDYLNIPEVEVLGCAIVCNNPPAITMNVSDAASCGGLGTVNPVYDRGELKVFNSNGVDVSAQMPQLPSGNYNYTLTDAQCLSTGTFEIKEPSKPEVTIVPVEPLLANMPAQSLIGLPLGGVWSGAANAQGQFDPSVGAGEYTVYYTYTDGNACGATDTLIIKVLNPDGCLDPQNLALNKPATQSSTYYGELASKAVDGDKNGDRNGGANGLSHTQYDVNAWLEIDLEQQADIESVKLYNRTDCCQDRLSNFYVFVSDVPFTSKDLNATLNQPGVTAKLFSGNAGSPGTISIDAEGRYVRVQLTTQEYLTIAELEVMGCFKTITCETPPVVNVNVVDAASCGGNGTVTITKDKGTVSVLNSLNTDVTTQLPNLPEGVYSYKVEEGDCKTTGSFEVKAPQKPDVSIDEAGPYPMNSGYKSLSAFPNGGVWGGDAEANGRFDTQKAAGTYTVTYTYTNAAGCDSTASIEIKVVDPAVSCAAPTNLALNKPATQSSDYYGEFASKAVDGNTDGDRDGGSNTVSHTEYEQSPWWQVDLQKISHIDEVQIFNRTDCCQERLSNMYVFVSETPFSSTDLNQTLLQNGVNAFYVEETVGRPGSITVGKKGRYVRIQLIAEDYLNLPEVRVLGCDNLNTGQRFLAPNEEPEVELTAVEAYPNPFKEGFRVEINGEKEVSLRLQIVNMLGQELYRNNDARPGMKLKLGADWPAGMYILRAVGDAYKEEIRLVKTK